MLLTAKTASQIFDLSLEPRSKIMYGKRDGFLISVELSNTNLILSLSASCNGQPPSHFENLNEICECLKDCDIDGNKITFVTSHAKVFTAKSLFEKANQNISEITQYLRTRGYVNCCESCTNTSDLEQFIIKGNVITVCNKCSSKVNADIEAQTQVKENFLLGIIGAILGSGIGLISIFIFMELGYVSSVSGLLMGFGTLYGYEKLAKKLSIFGAIISIIVGLSVTKISQILTGINPADLYPYVLVGFIFQFIYYLYNKKKSNVNKQLKNS